MTRTKKKRKSVSKKNSMYLISILDISNVLGLNKVKNLGDDFKTMKKVDSMIYDFAEKAGARLSRVKTDKFGNIIKMYYHLHHGVIEVTLSDITHIDLFFIDKRIAMEFRNSLRKYFGDVIDDSNELKNLFLESIRVFPKSDYIFAKLDEDSLIANIFEKSIEILLLSTLFFVIIEVAKAFFTEIFAEFLRIHQIFVVIIIAVVIALFFKPIERSVDHMMTKWLFKKD